jgi:hypothetical protein
MQLGKEYAENAQAVPGIACSKPKIPTAYRVTEHQSV